MKCPGCGLENREGARFCAICGTALTPAPQAPAEEAPAPQYTAPVEEAPAPQYTAPVEEAPAPEAGFIPPMPQFEMPEPAPKKPRKGLLIALITVAVILALGAILWFTNLFGVRDAVTNLYVNTFSSPETRLQHAYAQLATDTSSSVLKTIATADANAANANQTMTGSFSLTLGEGLSELDLGAAGVDLSALENTTLGINYEMTTEADLTAMKMELVDSGETLLTLNLFLDTAKQTMTLSAPGLTNEVLEYKMPAASNAAAPAVSPDAAAVVNYLQSALPEDQQLNKLLDGCIEAIFMSIEGVESENATFTAAGVSQSATKLTLNLNRGTLADMLLAAVTYLEESAELRAYLTDGYEATAAYLREQGLEEVLEGQTADSFVNEFFGELADLRNEILNNRDQFESQMRDVNFIWNTYVDSDNELLAVELIVNENRFFMGAAEDGDDFGLEIYMTDNGKKSLFTLNCTEKGDLINGMITLELEGKQIGTVEIENFNADAMEEDGAFLGNLTVRSPFFPAGFSFRLNATSANPNQAEFNIAALYNNADLLSVGVSAQLTDYKKITVPAATTQDPEAFGQSINPLALGLKLQKSPALTKIISIFTAASMAQTQQAPQLYY